jgi:predicted nucleotidyltransferase
LHQDEEVKMIGTLKHHQNEIARLCQMLDVKEMYVFGSAATNSSGDDRNCDFLTTIPG